MKRNLFSIVMLLSAFLVGEGRVRAEEKPNFILTQIANINGPLKLVETNYRLDGQLWHTQTSDAGAAASMVIFNGDLPLGEHLLEVENRYAGDCAFFSYFNDYSIKVSASHDFLIEPGRVLKIDAIAFQEAGFFGKIEESASIQFEVISSPMPN